MAHRIFSAFRKFSAQKAAVGRRRAGLAGVCRAGIEALERRELLSVADSVLAGPVTIPGNSWTYSLTDSSNVLDGYETLTSAGTVTRNGVSQVQVNLTFTNASGGSVGSGVNYYGFTPAGYFLYEDSDSSASTGATTDDLWASPFHELLPPTMTAGVPVTTPSATATETTSTSGGLTSTDTDTKVDTLSLVSDTPTSPVSLSTGTEECFEVDSTETDTEDGNAPTIDVTQTYISPSEGLVEIADQTVGTVLLLTKFTGTSYHLATSQPANTLVDDAINPAVQVSLQNSSGAVDTNADDAVTVTASLGSGGTGTGALGGTTSATTSGGVASFSNLTIDKPGKYVLTFADSAGRTVSTNQFNVSAGKLVFKHPVRNGVAGSALDPAVEVELENSKGKPITDASTVVTLSIAGTNSANPITGNSIQLVNGIALFPSLKLGVPGEYTLTATDDEGDTAANSSPFTITGVHLDIVKQPAEAGVNAPLKYVVEVKDARNRLVNTSSLGLALTLNTVEGGTNAVLATSADTVDFGKADNSGAPPASVNSPGEYTLTFTVINEGAAQLVYTIHPVTTLSFNVAANHLRFHREPAAIAPGMALTYEIVLDDYRNRPVTSSTTDTLRFTLIPKSDETGVLSGNTDTLQNGIATNSLTAFSIDQPGYYKLSVVDVPPSPTDPVATGVTSVFFKIRTVKK
jgi:hypothetical protein